MIPLNAVFEGPTDEPLVRALAEDAGFTLDFVRPAGGKPKVDEALPRYVAAARHRPWLILRDLDQDAACAPAWLSGTSQTQWLCLRLVVRAAEAWLMADRDAFADHFRVSPARVPENPELLDNPKRTLIDLVRHSANGRLRADVVPRLGAQVGPGYVGAIIEYTTHAWRLEQAVRRSDSLARARKALRELARRWKKQA